MKEKERWAFILDHDEFVRLSLNKILKKYGFQVEEIEDLSQLEGRGREIKGGMVLADMEIESLEKSYPFFKRWNDRIILMSPLISDDLAARLKRIGIQRIIKKPVEPKVLRKEIKGMTFPNGERDSSSTKKREGSRFDEKGGEER
jgi:FixJ family two-component response regulator